MIIINYIGTAELLSKSTAHLSLSYNARIKPFSWSTAHLISNINP